MPCYIMVITFNRYYKYFHLRWEAFVKLWIRFILVYRVLILGIRAMGYEGFLLSSTPELVDIVTKEENIELSVIKIFLSNGRTLINFLS